MKRLQYHFEPRCGWMNDPNGLVYFNGQYHAFFQHFPYAPQWGPMHWGHAVSQDLIHWRELPVALRPDQVYENDGGCFSGSAVSLGDQLYLFYTSVSRHLGQTQSMAYSGDGLHFTKCAANPILPACPVNSGEPRGNRDFRDPKVTYIQGRYYMVCGTGVDGVGKVLLFTTDDLVHWEYLGVLFSGGPEGSDHFYGTVIECPDFFYLDGHYVLMFSKMGSLYSATHFVIGDFDGEHFTPQQHVELEEGPDFYAPQTLLAPDGRRLMIGWMYHWGKPLPQGAYSAGALSLARELSIEQGRLHACPVREAACLLTEASPFVRVSGRTLTIESPACGHILSHELPAGTPLQILEDTKTIEVFTADGTWNATAWLE